MCTMLSSLGAGVWRNRSKAFPDSNSVLGKSLSASLFYHRKMPNSQSIVGPHEVYEPVPGPHVNRPVLGMINSQRLQKNTAFHVLCCNQMHSPEADTILADILT